MVRYVAVIDLGKSNSKLALVDTQINQELHVSTQHAAVNTSGLYPAIDHLSIETFLTEELGKLCMQFQVDAITVTTHGATAALIDKQGQLTLPVLDYECELPDVLQDEYKQYRTSFEKTGSPLSPGGLNIGAQLFWQQRTWPEQFTRTQTLLTWPQYWVFRLTGERFNEVTYLGAHTDLYEPLSKCYSGLVESQQWNRLLPPLRQPGEYIANTTPDITKRLGLKQAVPVHTGIHDSNASLVPYLMSRETSFSVVSTGTWIISMAVGGLSVPLNESRDTLLNVNAFGDAVPSARFMGGRERDILIGDAAERNDIALESLLAMPASEKPMLMPSVVPGTGPFPKANWQWLGTTHSDIPYRQCAVALYLALMTNQCLQLIGAQGSTYVEGPMAQDVDFLKMLKVASQRDVFASIGQTGTSIGAAMLITAPRTTIATSSVDVEPSQQTRLSEYATLWNTRVKTKSCSNY